MKTFRFIVIVLVLWLIIMWLAHCSLNAQVPDMETRMKRVEDSLGISWVSIPTDTTVVLPTYQGVILQTSQDTYPIPYSPIYKDTDGLYKIFTQRGNETGIYYSADAMIWNWQLVYNIPRGTVLEYGNKQYDSYHKWLDGKSYYYFAMSTDGVTFTDVATIRQPYGEDITFIVDNGKFRFYGRWLPPPYTRTITYFESPDFRTFTTPIEVLIPDATDFDNEFYSMSVIKTERGYFGLLNVFDRSTDLVSVQLVHSVNGKTEWRRLNNRNEFLIKRNNVQCLYGIWNVIGNEAWINTISAKFNHSESNKGSNKYFCELYKISLTDLYKSL